MENISFEAIKQGDLKAFEFLFREFYPSMCIVAMKFVSNRSVAEDIAQESFIRLWEKRQNYDSIPSLKTFLYVTVKNLCFNYLRDKKETIDCSDPQTERQDHLFRDLLIEEESYRILMQAVEALPAQSQRIIKLSLEGKKNKEIAEILQISVNSVKTLKYNALDTLKELLKNYFYLWLALYLKIM